VTWLRRAEARQPFSLESVQLGEQLRLGQDVGFELRDDFFACSGLADNKRIVPDAFGKLQPVIAAPDVDIVFAPVAYVNHRR